MHATPQRPELARHARLREDPKTGEPLLLYPEGFLALNEAAYAIASRCDGSRTLDQIISEIAAEFEVEATELRGDVEAFLSELKRRNLLLP